MNINQVFLYGNVCTDVEKKVAGSVNLFKFNLAVDNSMRKANGELKKDTLFISCVSFNEKQAGSLTKGSRVFVGGRLKLESWEKDGKKHNKHVVMCEMVMSQDSSAEVATIEPKQDNKTAKLEAMIDNLGAKKIQAFDDDLPF
jgi:single stranded DNA-binding protein